MTDDSSSSSSSSSSMPTPLMTRVAEFLQSDEGKVQFWIAVAVVVVGHVAWTRYQAWRETATTKAATAAQLSATEQAELRRRRFERLQQQQQQQQSSLLSHDNPSNGTTTTTTSIPKTSNEDDNKPKSSETVSGREKEYNDSKKAKQTKGPSEEDKAPTVTPTKKKKTVPRKTPVECLLTVLRSLLFKTSNNSNNNNSNKSSTLVSFYNHIQSTIPADATWEQLTQDYWPAVLQARPLPYDSLQQALTWLHRMRDVIQYATVTTAETQPHLETCLHTVLRRDITQRMAESLAQAAQQQQHNPTADSEEDFELGALFCEDYGDTHANTTAAQSNDSTAPTTATAPPIIDPLTELLRLLQPVDTIVSTRFLQDLHQMQPNLSPILLQMALDAIPRIDPCSSTTVVMMQGNKILPSLSCLANLVTLSPAAAKELHSLMAQQVKNIKATAATENIEGREVEKHSVLRKLLPIAALSVPNLGQETPSQQPQRTSLSLFQNTLRQQVEHYPVGVFMKNNQTARQVMDDARRIMQQGRDKCTVILKRAMKAEAKPDGQRPCFFQWLSLVLQTNEANVHVLASDLLREDGPQQICASRKFLLGAASVVVNFCVDALWERYHKLGSTAFDALFLIHPDTGLVVEGERCLLPSNAEPGILASDNKTFAGTTEFFFLSAALLRVALFPGLRADQELGRQYGPLFEALRRAGQVIQNDQQIPPNLLDERTKTSVDALLGWETALQDPELVRAVTKLSILQLKWLASVAKTSLATKTGTASDSVLSVVPEWFCKYPAEWIAFVAARAPKVLSVSDGEAAVECATMLLHLGSELQGQDFSPPVITELIRIPGAFVRSGVARARASMAAKHAKAMRGRPLEEQQTAMQNYIVDERKCQVDIAHDRNGLGTTAFTNSFVQNRLSSTLLSTFSALDAVEGVNVEREHAFDKFNVKGEVAELLLRLWSHPAGGAKLAVSDCPPEELAVFVSSVVSAIGLQVDDSCLKLLDIREIFKKSQSPQLLGRDAHYYDYMAKTVAGGFAGARKLLRLLMNVMEDDKVVAILGGFDKEGKVPVTRNLANLFLSLIERFTSDDGRENSELRFDFLGPDFDTSSFLANELGLDVGVLVHYLLALAARLHTGYTKMVGGRSLFVEFVAQNEDCSASHLRAVLQYLIVTPERRVGHQAKIKGTQQDNNRRWFVAQDQMSHASFESLAGQEDIERFIDAVQASEERISSSVDTVLGVQHLEKEITNCSCQNNDETYTECLEEWTFSSDSFSTSTGRFDHFYDGLARKRSHVVSAKILQKEAKKTKKLLPDPLASAAIFVCFAEERMDVCKAIVTGAESTPYSLGFFAFDLFFPATYPSVPPLITFLTTGGGQVRFSPNLYNDGKVCISLLGTAHAWNAAQQWNKDSSLAQVLMSIQTQILGVNDPYFSEGFGHANTKGTPAGEEASARYNNNIRLATVRHAMIAHLKSPPCGFEEVTIRHFSLCRKRLVVQVRRWMAEARGSPIEKKFERAYATLVKLLSSDRMREFAAYYGKVLPPLDEDIECLRRLDPEFARTHLKSHVDLKPSAALPSTTGDQDETSSVEDQKPPASTAVDPNLARLVVDMIGAQALASNNPWARTNEDAWNQSRPNGESEKHQEEDDDDEMYK